MVARSVCSNVILGVSATVEVELEGWKIVVGWEVYEHQNSALKHVL